MDQEVSQYPQGLTCFVMPQVFTIHGKYQKMEFLKRKKSLLSSIIKKNSYIWGISHRNGDWNLWRCLQSNHNLAAWLISQWPVTYNYDNPAAALVFFFFLCLVILFWEIPHSHWGPHQCPLFLLLSETDLSRDMRRGWTQEVWQMHACWRDLFLWAHRKKKPGESKDCKFLPRQSGNWEMQVLELTSVRVSSRTSYRDWRTNVDWMVPVDKDYSECLFWLIFASILYEQTEARVEPCTGSELRPSQFKSKPSLAQYGSRSPTAINYYY